MANALLTSIVDDVYTMTKRPDLVADTLLAVKKATLKAHHTDFYPKDLLDSGLQFDTLEYIQCIEYRTLFPRFRTLAKTPTVWFCTTSPSRNPSTVRLRCT